jgi:hypothetical protein
LVRKPETYKPVVDKSALDLRAHVECEKHEKAVGGEVSLAKVTSFFTTSGSKSDAVLAAEGAFVFHTVKHNRSYKGADDTSILFKSIFPDSEIALNFQVCGQR